MIIFIPYRTDAPIYHFPWGTIGLVSVNTAVFIACMATGADVKPWSLNYGDGLHPVQWVTSVFLHADILHLLGNMIFLWVFGMIVEGKTGAGLFLGVYFGTAILQSAIEQTLLLSLAEGSSLGASGVITSLLGISMIWAPANKVSVFYFFWFILVRTGTFELKVTTLGIIYVGLDLIWFFIWGMLGTWVTSEMLHLLGLAVGVPVGIVLLRRGLVDCEGWDWFSIRSGETRRRMFASVRSTAAPFAKHRAAAVAEDRSPAKKPLELDVDLELLREHLAAGDGAAARECFRSMRGDAPDLTLPESDLAGLIRLYPREGNSEGEVRRLMAEYHQSFPRGSPVLHLGYAHLLIEREYRPRLGLQVLESIDPAKLTPELSIRREHLAENARRSIENGALELED